MTRTALSSAHTHLLFLLENVQQSLTSEEFMSRTSRLVIALGLLAVAVPVTLLAHHSWGGYHWARTSNPFTVKLGDNVSGAWDSMLQQASSDWSQSTVLDSSVPARGVRAH